ncbi:MAG: hypothetical protein ACHQT6_00970 [Candidatus Acidiferrales bacterium]
MVRLADQLLPGQFRKKPIYLIVAIFLFFYLAYELAQLVLSGNLIELALIGLLFVVFAFLLSILKNWRRGCYLFLGWLMFEDLVRKYLGNNMAIYFGKDLLLAVVYLSFFLAYRRKEVSGFRPPFQMALLLFVWFGIIQVFNPGSPSLFFGVLGVKIYFYYIPLIIIGHALIRSEQDLIKFFSFCMLVLIIIGSLGIVQAILGHTFLNPEHPQEDIRELSQGYRAAPISGVIVYRPTSVFVSNGRFAFYLLPAWLMAFGFSGYVILRKYRDRKLPIIALGVASVATVLTSSRGSLLWTSGSLLVASAAFLWGAPWRQGEVVRVIRTLGRALIAGAISFGLILAIYPSAVNDRLALYWETLNPWNSNSELYQRTNSYPLQNFMYAFQYPRWPYGYGIGTSTLGIQYIQHILHVQPLPNYVESGYGGLVLELGIVGLILWLIMTAAIVLSAWRVVVKLRGSPLFPIGFVIFWFALLLLFPETYAGLQTYQDFVLNAHLWLLLGVLFRLPKLVASSKSGVATAGNQPLRTFR